MARAKSTARSDARRRYRAEQARLEGSEASAVEPSPSAPSGPKPSQQGATAPAPGQRVSIGTAFRTAFRPLDLRADLAALPALVIRSKAIWLPSLVILASTAFIAVSGIQNIVAAFMYQYFIATPAIGGVFFAGFLAPRASWLAGILVGLVSAICFSILVLVFPTTLYETAPTPAQAQELVIASLVLSPGMGAFFAASAAWYRRFLQLTNPNRSNRSQGKGQRPDGRTRSSNSQKAGARR